MDYVNSILKKIGNTPLLKLTKVTEDVKANVFVKLEFLNPSGSYKDRMALSMVEAAEKGLTWNDKTLRPGGVVCDASAGNTAAALAFVCAVPIYQAHQPYVGHRNRRRARYRLVRALSTNKALAFLARPR